LEKGLLRRNTLDTREPRTENQSVWRSNLRYNQRVKPALIRAFTKSVNKTSTYLLGIYFKEDPSSKDVQIKLDMAPLHVGSYKRTAFLASRNRLFSLNKYSIQSKAIWLKVISIRKCNIFEKNC
jgi:hypothetical protein